MKYIETDGNHEDFRMLCGMLDEYLNIAIGGENKREKYKEFNSLESLDYVLLAYEGNIAVGCAALRQYDEKTLEVKRVYVKDEFRGRGIARNLIESLIHYSKVHDFSKMILETGAFLACSVNLYKALGFQKIQNYGSYVNMKESLCMSLDLKNR